MLRRIHEGCLICRQRAAGKCTWAVGNTTCSPVVSVCDASSDLKYIFERMLYFHTMGRSPTPYGFSGNDGASHHSERARYECIWVLTHCLQHDGYSSQQHRRVNHTSTGWGMNGKVFCVFGVTAVSYCESAVDSSRFDSVYLSDSECFFFLCTMV